jgi:phosphopantetheinyl transferase
MREYFQTMENFLKVQEEVMRAFLSENGRSPSSSPESDSGPTDRGAIQGHLQNVARRGHGGPSPETSSPGGQEPPEEILNKDPMPPAGPSGEASFPSSHDTTHLAYEDIQRTLLALISEKTGYPEEMLGLNLDMEADLGIDSIKRIEVLGAFAVKTGIAMDRFIEESSRFKRLQQLIEFLDAHLSKELNPGATLHPPESAPVKAGSEPLGASGHLTLRHPLIDEIVSIVEGRELVARRKISLKEDRHLYDHILGGKTSVKDDGLHALPVMPLTLSMELLAEAGSLLIPNKTLIGMKAIRGYHWITLEEEEVQLKIVARVPPGAPQEAHVQAYKLAGEAGITETLVIEGTAVFGSTYPQAPCKDALTLFKERPSKWSPHQLYTEAMFHGPSWQGVSSVDRWGENGSVATLAVLPAEGFFSSRKQDAFLTDPIVLDAAGQVVAFWTMEHLERGFMVFPYELKALHIYRKRLPVHQKVTCEAQINLTGPQLVSSNIDLLDENGELWMRLEEWKDKRFDLPPRAYAFLLSPIEVIPSVRLDEPLASLPNADSLLCYGIERLFVSDGAFWRHVFAHLILNARERETFRSIGKSERRRNHWLMGRLVAKDAIRASLKERYGLRLAPADVEIKTDGHGRPVPYGTWLNDIDGVPALSLAHTDGVAVAVVGWGAGHRGLGIDVEKIRPILEEGRSAAFSPRELDLLKRMDESQHQEWLIRFWSAKEAAAKALGPERFSHLVVQKVHPAEGLLRLGLDDALGKISLDVKTIKERGHIVAVTVWEGDGQDEDR